MIPSVQYLLFFLFLGISSAMTWQGVIKRNDDTIFGGLIFALMAIACAIAL